jgi:hypothetical protein
MERLLNIVLDGSNFFKKKQGGNDEISQESTGKLSQSVKHRKRKLR